MVEQRLTTSGFVEPDGARGSHQVLEIMLARELEQLLVHLPKLALRRGELSGLRGLLQKAFRRLGHVTIDEA